MHAEVEVPAVPSAARPADRDSRKRDAERLHGADAEVLVIAATNGWRSIDVREVWKYRGLLVALAYREVKIRYKQTALGAAWAIIQPLMTSGLFTILFAVLLGRGREPGIPGVPYLVSTFAAMLPWQLFAQSLTQSANSLLQNQQVITKIYFPRLILPCSAVLAAVVDFAVAMVAMTVLMAVYGIAPSWPILTLPLFLAMALMASLAGGFFFSAMSVRYRDFRYVVPFLIQLGMFASPVVYSTLSLEGRLPEWALLLYALNPLVGVIEGFRWALLGSAQSPGPMLIVSLTTTFLCLVGSMYFFRRMERDFADII